MALAAILFSTGATAQEVQKQKKKAKIEKASTTADKKKCSKEEKAKCCAKK